MHQSVTLGKWGNAPQNKRWGGDERAVGPQMRDGPGWIMLELNRHNRAAR